MPLLAVEASIMTTESRPDLESADNAYEGAGGAVPSAKPMLFRDWAQLDKPVDWLIEGRLQDTAGTAMLLCAEPKAGKSTVMTSLTKALLDGGDWLGWAVKPKRVGFMVFDEPIQTFAERLRAVGIALPHPRLEVVNFPPDSPHQVERFVERFARESRAEVIMTDTLFDLLGIDNSDKYGTVKPILTKLRHLGVIHGFEWVWSHHANKGEQRRRMSLKSVMGSGAFTGSSDCIVLLEKEDGSSRRFISTRQRRGIDLERTEVLFDPRDGSVRLGLSKAQSDAARITDAILRVIPEDGIEREQLAISTGMRKERVRVVIDQLTHDGVLKTTGLGRKGSPKLYFKNLHVQGEDE